MRKALLKLTYLKWRYRIRYGQAAPDPFRLLSIDPMRIKYKGSSTDFEDDPPIFGIVGGEWDLKKIEHHPSEYRTFRLLEHRYVDGMAWEDIPEYQEDLKRLREGKSLGRLDGPQTVENYKQYHEYLDELYESMKTNGFVSQRDLDDSDDYLGKQTSILNEPAINIGREGELIKDHGAHRIIMAKILELPEIVVRVRIRHQQWQDIRRTFASTDSTDALPTEVRKYLDHPDLNDLS